MMLFGIDDTNVVECLYKMVRIIGGIMMLSQNQIRDALIKTVSKYPIKSISLFGSYAEGSANEDSDVDLLVEFLTPAVSLFMLYELKSEVEAEPKKNVELVHLPIPADSIIKINKVVTLYEN